MSLSTLRMNFYRIASLIIDHGTESMRCLLDKFIQKKYRSSFRDYVSNHQHEIYHYFNNGICCLCSKNERRPYQTVISAWQMEKLFDKNSPKLSKHKYSSKCDYCCSTVKSTLLLQDIDITLLRFFLVTYFAEEFWQSCFTSGIVFHDFLNTHKHDIFHLLQLNTPCCICIAHPGYTTMGLNEKDRLNKTQWETMFHTSEFPCIQHRNYCPDGYTLNPCSVSATIGIRPSDLDGRARMILLSKFCTMMRHIDGLVNARNTSYAHAIKGELSNEVFRQLWDEIENSIVYISNITSTVDSRKLCILELREKSLEESMCLELQCFILKQIHGDEQVLKACGKIQDTFEMVKEVIAQKLQQINLQITAFTSSISDVVRNELSVQLNEYSDITRNIIDNTRTEIECRDRDKTYVKTSAVTTATELLESNNLLIICGRTGSGKTTTALEVASVFHDNGYIIMKVEQNLAKDFKTYFISKNKQLIIFEDLFGKADVRYNEDIHSNLLEVLKPHVFNGVSKFIITIRSYKSEIDDEIATYHQLLSEGKVLNLNGSSSLSDSEKHDIIKMHAKHCGREISFNEMLNIVTTDPYLGFPEACHLFFSSEKLFAMGHAFFTSPTKVFQNEINFLKRSGHNDIDSAIKYCVLVCLMMDSACKDSFSKNIYRREAHKSDDPSNNCENITSFVIEYFYQSLYDKKIGITNIELKDMCEELTKTYIKYKINSNTYVFQHQTVFEAVLYSFWHDDTMAYVIKNFKADILAEHFRPFDSILKGFKKFVIVPENHCTDLACNLFETFLANFHEFCKCYSLIKQSAFILNLFNSKLAEWVEKEEHILKCDWIIIKNFIRPFKCKKGNDIICANANDKYLTQRLSNELDNRTLEVNRYIEKYGGNVKFIIEFNEKLAEWFQSKETVLNCNWKGIDYFIRPTTFKIKYGEIGIVAKNDDWLIQRLINRLVETFSHKEIGERTYEVNKYIERYGSETFVKYFNEKLSECFQSEESVLNCHWKMIDYFIRPKSFPIESGQVGIVSENDVWLIQRLINRLVQTISHQEIVERTYEVNKYIERYGSETFVKYFNEKLSECFQSEESVLNCYWKVIDYFIRPKSFPIESGQVGIVAENDVWLIQRLINRLVDTISHQEIVERTYEVNKYIERYGSETFVKYFNEKLSECFQSEESVFNCHWKMIDYFIRPKCFPIESGQVGIVAENDDWLIQRLINRLVKTFSYKEIGERTYEVNKYIEKYGSETFVKYFNEKLSECFQSEESVLNCYWKVIDYFIRPKSFPIESGQVGIVAENDVWLIQRLINRLGNTFSHKEIGERTYEVNKYIERYGSETFVKYFNEKLSECFQSEESICNCYWKVIDYFIRPKSFPIESGQIGIVTKNDDWLIQRLINRLVETISHQEIVKRTYEVNKYIERYGSETFVKCFNEKFSECFQSEESVLNCYWKVIDYFIRPKSFPIESGQVGIVTENDVWLIQRLINRLVETISHQEIVERTYEVNKYIERYGSETFVKYFNEKLSECFQSEESVLNCHWKMIDYFIRPKCFPIESGQVGIVAENDVWLIQRLINRLVDTISYQEIVERTYEVNKYIERYGSETFVKYFNKKLSECFQSEESVLNCYWKVIDYFIRPKSFPIESGQVGIVAENDDWLIQRLINRLGKTFSHKEIGERTYEVNKYIERYGSETFVKYFNEKLSECFQSEESVLNCYWKVIDYFIRPTSFPIESGQIGIVAKNDDWLIQRLINRLVETISHQEIVERTYEVNKYIERYGSETFVKCFNEKVSECFQSEESVINCYWKVIDYFIRPKSFPIESGQVGIVAENDVWLIQRLINRLVNTISHQEIVERTYEVNKYIERYGSETFVKYFNEKLSECFQSEKSVLNCHWKMIDYFIRPKSFPIESGQVGIVAKNDDWLIQRLINRLVETISHQEIVERTYEVNKYIERYGSETFVKYFKEKLSECFQSEKSVLNCHWKMIDYFIRPKSFPIESGQVGIVAKNDDWLIQRLINRLVETISHQEIDERTYEVNKYIERYGSETFVKYFNEKLSECFQSEESVLNCYWKVIDYFIRPKSFPIESGQVGIVAKNDDWLIQRLINRLGKTFSHKEIDERTYEVNKYIERYGSETFVKYFNEKLSECFQSEESVLNCYWKVIDYFIRPKSFPIESGQVGIVAKNDDWLIQRLINILMKPDDDRAWSIERYIKKYGCEQFVNSFNGKLAEFIQSEEDIVKCNLNLFSTFVRPQSCLGFEKIRILVQDERVIIYLFSKLEQPTNVYTVKQYISKYGSDQFKTKFNERLKEKVKIHDVLDQNCKWDCLELFFDNVASSEASDIDNIFEDSDIDIGNVSDMDSSISIDTNNTESDSNIDVDSSNHSEGSDNETNHNPSSNNNNGVLVMME